MVLTAMNCLYACNAMRAQRKKASLLQDPNFSVVCEQMPTTCPYLHMLPSFYIYLRNNPVLASSVRLSSTEQVV